MDVVADERPVPPHHSCCSVELKAQIALGMNAVVDEEVDLAEFGEEPR
jgi:hypothetical protein